MFSYKTRGTCAREIQLEMDGTKVKEIKFIGGCSGNTQGVALLCQGRDIDEIVPILSGVDCAGRGTSCPDQLAKALTEYKSTLA